MMKFNIIAVSLIFMSLHGFVMGMDKNVNMPGRITIFSSSDFYYAQELEARDAKKLEDNTLFNKYMLKIVHNNCDNNIQKRSGRKIRWNKVNDSEKFDVQSPLNCINPPQFPGNVSPTSVAEFVRTECVDAKKAPVKKFKIEKMPLFWTFSMYAFADKNKAIVTPKTKSCVNEMQELD